MTPRRKRHLTYITIGVFFLLGGVEYDSFNSTVFPFRHRPYILKTKLDVWAAVHKAVILPTVWLYLDTRFHAPTYFLGFVLSAFSVADLLAGPQLGRWSDSSHNTKLVLLVANLPQIGGCLMYFIGLSPWMLVAGRFVAGLGSGASAALFADIARVTSSSERTAVMAVFMSVRQIGLLIGPGCNLFLRQLYFSIGPFPVDRYTSPGLFMAILWTLHELLTVVMFWNLPALHLQEQLETVEANYENTQPVNVADTQPAAVDTEIVSRDCAISPAVLFIPQQPVQVTPSTVPRPVHHIPSAEHQLNVSDTSSVTMSNEFIEEAEELMHAEQNSSSIMEPTTAVTDTSGFDVQHLSWPCIAVSPISRTNSDSFLQQRRQFYGTMKRDNVERNILPTDDQQTDGQTGASGVSTVRDAEMPQIVHETSVPATEPELSLNSLTWQYYCDEFIREEIVAILGMMFVAFFSQISMETMLTPLTQRLLHWGELENSILFCGAGVEVILVFAAVRLLSRRLSDRTLILAGLFLESAAVAFLLWFIPQATDDDVSVNLCALLVALIVDLLGIPVVAVATNSLFSKITRKETQGLAQGIRRIFAQFGLILGPLWAGSMLNQPYYMFGIMLALNLLFMILLLLSFSRLLPIEEQDEEERRPLLS